MCPGCEGSSDSRSYCTPSPPLPHRVLITFHITTGRQRQPASTVRRLVQLQRTLLRGRETKSRHFWLLSQQEMAGCLPFSAVNGLTHPIRLQHGSVQKNFFLHSEKADYQLSNLMEISINDISRYNSRWQIVDPQRRCKFYLFLTNFQERDLS